MATELSDKTHWAMRRAERALERAAFLLSDPQARYRVQVAECRACYYLDRGRVAGHGFTPFKCELCKEVHQHENTAVPKAGIACATTTGVCRRCLGAIEWPTTFPRRYVAIIPEPSADAAPDWTGQRWSERYLSCAQALGRVGLVTDSERGKIAQRMKRLGIPMVLLALLVSTAIAQADNLAQRTRNAERLRMPDLSRVTAAGGRQPREAARELDDINSELEDAVRCER